MTCFIVMRDGLPLAAVTGEGDAGASNAVFAWLLSNQGQSVDYALTHGGYSICEDQVDVRGWNGFLLAERHPSGQPANHLAARTIRALDRSLDAWEGQYGGEFADYLLQGEVFAPMLAAARMLLNYTSGHMSVVNGALDAWIVATAQRVGLSEDLEVTK